MAVNSANLGEAVDHIHGDMWIAWQTRFAFVVARWNFEDCITCRKQCNQRIINPANSRVRIS